MITALSRVLVTSVVVLGVLFSSTPSTAASLTIQGNIYDSATRQPIQDVKVFVGIPGAFVWARTDAVGHYFIDMDQYAAQPGSQWELYFIKDGYETAYYGKFFLNGPYTVPDVLMVSKAPPAPGTCAAPRVGTPTQTVYLPNITKTLGGPGGWVTPFIVQNTGTAVTTLEVSFYKFSDGSCVARRTVSNLGAGKSYADIPNNDADLPGDSQFSVVVNSFGSSIVSTVNQVQGSGATFQALSYSGTSTGSTTAYLPNVTRRFYGWDVPFIIQNVGTTTTTTSSIFTSIASPSCTVAHTWTKSLSIDAGRSKVVDPDFEAAYSGANGSGLRDGCQYAVVVTSAQPIAVVANAHNESGAPVAYSHNGLTGGAKTIYAPYAAFNGPSGRFSPIVVQNVDTAAADATIEFTPLGGGTAKTFTLSAIAGRASKAFDPRYSGGDTSTGVLCNGTASATCLASGEYSVRISSAGNVAAVVLPVTGTTASAYAAALSAQRKSYLPNVTRTLGGATGWTTPIVLQSSTATAVTLQWCPFSGLACTTQNVTLSPNTARWIDPATVPGLSENTQYAVVADAGAGGAITAIVFQRNTSGGDGDMIYEGFPSP